MSFFKHIPNLFTIFNLLIGILGIINVFDGNYQNTLYFIIIASIFDFFDGFTAKLLSNTSLFGKELDSLTDFVSFGIAPVFVLYFWELNNYGKLGWAICLIYSVCCVLRLARFNLTKISETDQWKNNFFEGVPSPAGLSLIHISEPTRPY